MKLKTGLGDKPLWSQVYDVILERIRVGQYPSGSILPPEVQLMEELDVSRTTMRQAMDKLLSEGLISRQRGKGTIVLEKRNTFSTVFQSSFSNVTEMKRDINREVLSVQMVEPLPEIKFDFDMSEGDNRKVLELVRTNRDSRGELLTIHYTYIHPMVALTLENDFSLSLYQAMEDAGYPIESVIEEISASISDDNEKSMFCVHHDTAIIKRLRKGFSHGKIVEYTISKYNAEGYTLIINNK